MRNINIAYIGGGSRGWGRILMNDLVKEKDISGSVRLYDIDTEAAKINEKIGNLYNDAEGAVSRWDYYAVDSLEDTLHGVDAVVISILPGTFDQMENDVHYPEKYGIYQSVGDTAGPGGIMRSIRAIPMYAHIAKAIEKKCPDAIVITYTNPMTVLTKTLYSIFPGIKALGCCHEVFGTQRLLIDMLADMGVSKVAKRHDIKVNVLGINHFTWIDKATYRNIDLIPIYEKFVDKYYKSGYSKNGEWNKTLFSSGSRVKFDLFRQYGIIAAAGDRHLAENCPGWYLKNPRTVRNWQFSLTPVSWRKRDLIERIEKTMRIYNGNEKPVLRDTGEEGVAMLKALKGMGRIMTNVNTTNRGQHEGLPLGAVVETNAVFSKDGIEPVDAGRLPGDVENLVLRQVKNQESLVKACLNQDRKGVQNVFINDPMVYLRKQDAVKLFDEMFEKNKAFFKGEV